MASFHQPIPDKSLVNWDIRGARAKYIEKEVKLYERESKSPPIPQKQSSDYVVNTRHGPNPNVIRAQQPNLEVHLPQGQSAFDLGGKRHYALNQGEIKEKRSLENPYNLPQNYEFIQPYYPRSLNVKDIDGAIPGTLASKVVKNKEQAQKIIKQEKNELQILKDLQKNPYEKYQDALDRFKSEMNVGNQDYRDRHHYIDNIENPYAPIDHPKYNNNQESQQNTKDNQSYLYSQENNRDKQSIEQQQRKYNDEESYKPRQFRDDYKGGSQDYVLQQQQQPKQEKDTNERARKDYELYLEYLKEKEKGTQREEDIYQSNKQLQSQNRVNSDNQRKYEEQQNSYKDQEYKQSQNNREIYLKEEDRRRFSAQNEQNPYLDNQRIRNNASSIQYETEQRSKFKEYNPQQGNRQPSPDAIDYKRNDVLSSYKSQPNLLKLNHQQEIISHTMNNVSPQITKQTLAPNLNIEGYIGQGRGQRLNPTSMSYVGTELANKNVQIGHNIIGNQIYRKEKTAQQLQKDPYNYTHAQLNFQKFEKYPGEFYDILKAQGKPPTNENLFQLQYERSTAPKSTIESILKYPVNLYEKGEANLDHYKKDTNPVPNFHDVPQDYYLQQKEGNQQYNDDSQNKNQYGAPFGAPFSYNPNEYKKKAMVALNHSKQLEKIEHQIDVVDKNIHTIQRASPDIQQPHIKKTLHSNRYDELARQFQAEDEEKIRNKREYQQYLEQKHQSENFAGLGSYGEQGRNKIQEQKQNQSMEYIQQFGAKGLRNLSNVRIC